MLTLPNFPVTAVVYHHEEFVQQQINLAAYTKQHDRGLILYFYPKDNTAGCSVQAMDFSQHLDNFRQLGYDVLGVSRDSLKSHEKFITAKQITFPLISDTDQQLCDYFGVIGEKNMYGKKVLGVVRSTFVFDNQGQLQQELRNIRAKGHVESLLAQLA